MRFFLVFLPGVATLMPVFCFLCLVSAVLVCFLLRAAVARRLLELEELELEELELELEELELELELILELEELMPELELPLALRGRRFTISDLSN